MRLQSLGVYGRVTADTFDGKRLPYTDNVVNLLVVSDGYDVPDDEMIRVLAPRGVALIAAAGGQASEGRTEKLEIGGATWRKFVKPTYEALFGPCRDRGVPVHLHSDGHILEIIPDLIETGVRVLNPQIRANGLAGLQEVARGKVALAQDLDRQLFPFATPDEIEAHVTEVFEGLCLKEGGLLLQAECGPDVPLENIEALCRVMERLCNPPDLTV